MFSHLAIPTSHLLQALWEKSPNGLILYQVIRNDAKEPIDFRYILVNQAAADFIGAKPEAIVGQSCQVVFPQGAVLRAYYQQVALTGHTCQVDYELSADSRWFEVLITYPQPDTLLCFFSDITDRHRFKTDLWEENRRLNDAQTIGKVGSFEWNLGQLVVNWSDEMYRIHGLSPQAIPITIDMTSHFFHPDDRLALEALQQQSFRSPGPYGLIHRSQRVDGSVVWVDHQFESIADATGQVVRVHGTVQDITAYRQTQQQHQESERRFRDIAEHVDEIFWIRDLHEPTFLYMNPAYQTFSGRSPQVLYEDPLSFLACILEEDRSMVREAFISPHPRSSFRFRIRHLDGRIFWMHARIFMVQDQAGLPIRRIGVATDITAGLEKESILEESLANERLLNRLKSQFIETASHEFRTPLTAIQSSADLIRQYVDRETDRPSSAHIRRHLAVISEKLTALTNLLGDTLTLSQIEAGTIQVHLERTDLVSLSSVLIESTFGGELATQRPVHLEVIGSPLPVLMDRKLLSRVLTNLLSNALKFSKQSPRLTILFEPGFVSLSVSDSGIGIPATERAHLFNKFFRASNAKYIQGTGLGLAICQDYVRLLQGRIDVDSTEGMGTTFTIRLPLSE